jgi:two-component system LytT family response regulator
MDDEPLAVAELESMLKKHKEIEVVGTATDPQEAIQSMSKLDIDLLFLDINMPGMNGFQFLEELDAVPEVIFVTAYDQYAIKAFEINALDYLLKPLSKDRLQESLNKALQRTGSEKQTALTADQRIFIKDGESCHFVPVPDIEWMESIGNYVRVYYGKGKPMLHRSLNYMEERLPSDIFFRANRQNIFNVNYVADILPYFNNSLQVQMKSGKKLEMSQRQSTRFKQMMGI